MKRTFLILWTSSFLLCGCQTLPEYPIHPVYAIDYDHKICGEYEIVDKEKAKFGHVKDWPLSHCEGFFAIHYKTLPKVKAWILDVIRILKERQGSRGMSGVVCTPEGENCRRPYDELIDPNEFGQGLPIHEGDE